MARLSHAAGQSAHKEVSPLFKGSRTSMIHWDCDRSPACCARYSAVPGGTLSGHIYDAFILWGCRVRQQPQVPEHLALQPAELLR